MRAIKWSPVRCGEAAATAGLVVGGVFALLWLWAGVGVVVTIIGRLT